MLYTIRTRSDRIEAKTTKATHTQMKHTHAHGYGWKVDGKGKICPLDVSMALLKRTEKAHYLLLSPYTILAMVLSYFICN